MSIFKFFIELLRLFIETNKTENIVFFKDELEKSLVYVDFSY